MGNLLQQVAETLRTSSSNKPPKKRNSNNWLLTNQKAIEQINEKGIDGPSESNEPNLPTPEELDPDYQRQERIKQRHTEIREAFQETESWRDDGHFPALPKELNIELPKYLNEMRNRVEGINQFDPKTDKEFFKRIMPGGNITKRS